jgi:hypothetical protein
VANPRARRVVVYTWNFRPDLMAGARRHGARHLSKTLPARAEVAALTSLSPNTVKSYIRSIYRKIGVSSRTQAVRWGIAQGFTPDHHRIEHWKGGP